MSNTTLTKKKKITRDRVLDLMRAGSVLVKTHARGVAYWHLIPQQIEISENTARKVLEHSAVQPSYDGLFGTSQTFTIQSVHARTS